MSFALASDLHLEFVPPWVQVPMSYTPNPTASRMLVLAGDICAGTVTSFKNRIAELASPFEMVLYVPGNHEYYDSTLSFPMKEVNKKMEAACSAIPNVVFLQKKSVVLGHTAFLGCTLWTNPDPSLWKKTHINDFNLICGHERGVAFTPAEMVALHKDHAAWIRGELKRVKNLMGVTRAVVITHHSPDPLLSKDCTSRPEEMKPWYYASDMGDVINDPFIKIWCHGHTHESYVVKSSTGAMFATNALGYQHEETGFSREAVVRL